jgi:hypothetical protein
MDQRSSEAATDQEAEAEGESLRFSELFRPGGEAVVHIDPSPLRQAVRAHFKKYAGVTGADDN